MANLCCIILVRKIYVINTVSLKNNILESNPYHIDVSINTNILRIIHEKFSRNILKFSQIEI